MNWKRWLQLASQIVAVLLAGLTAHNVQAINAGVIQDAGIPQYSLVGLEGLGSVGSLILSLVMSWKSGGGINLTRTAETAAVVTLFATCAADGDKEGMTLTSQLAAHFSKRSKVQTPDLSSVDRLAGELRDLVDKLRTPATPAEVTP
jgi:hypothetical protein